MMSNPYKGPERRQFERVPVDLMLTYRIHEPLKIRMLVSDREIEAEISDLSEGGMAMVTNYNIPISTILLMKFTLINESRDSKDRKTIHLIGEVRYNILLGQAGHRLGISFTDISKDNKQALSSFVRNLLAE